jgi:hypothetical protein
MNAVAEADADAILDALGFDGTNEVGPYGPSGLATFVLDLETGYKVVHRWPFDLRKFESGEEQRISQNDAPQESYDGSAVLLGDQPRDVRATLARHAAQTGAAFLLALPHEEISILDISGATVTVGTTTKSDWAKQGQRVVSVWVDADGLTQFVEGTIQDVTATQLELDQAPSAASYAIMPLRPVFFEPQQTFARHPVEAEVWAVQARAALFDFAPTLAELDMGDEVPSLVGNALQSRVFGAGGAVEFTLLTSAGYPATGSFSESTTPPYSVLVLARSGVTTMGDVEALLVNSALVRMTEVNASYVIQAADNFGATLSGGTTAGSIGSGATLSEYAGDGTTRPVWDRELVVATTAADSIQAMTQIIDHGGIPYSLGTADEPDWGRAVSFVSEDWSDWQWLKLFFATTLGPQEAFWLPTWRADMDFVSSGVGTVTVEVEDLRAWWPYQREHVQFIEADGTATYAKIADAEDNGDGTWTLTLDDPDTVPDTDPVLISWLELCRFEDDEFEFVFGEHGVRLVTTARVVRQ